MTGALPVFTVPVVPKTGGMQEGSRNLTYREERDLLKAVHSRTGWQARRDEYAIHLMLYGGLRVGTLIRLTLADAQYAIARKQLFLRPEICKRNSGYTLPINEKLEAALRGLLYIRRQLTLPMDPEAPLLLSRVRARAGDGMTARGVQLRLKGWVHAALINPQVSPHWLRHTFARRKLEESQARDPLLVVSKLMGHRNISSTAIYTQPSREELIQAMGGAI